MLSSEISPCLAEAVGFMLVKCVGCGDLGEIEVVAKEGWIGGRGGSFACLPGNHCFIHKCSMH